jgi:hypothetical protein
MRPRRIVHRVPPYRTASGLKLFHGAQHGHGLPSPLDGDGLALLGVEQLPESVLRVGGLDGDHDFDPFAMTELCSSDIWCVAHGTALQYHPTMKRAHRKTLEAVLAHPTSANIAWKDIETMLMGLGAEVSEREGSRVAIVLFNEVRVFHRPHPSPHTDKGAVASVRRWLEQHGVKP